MLGHLCVILAVTVVTLAVAVVPLAVAVVPLAVAVVPLAVAIVTNMKRLASKTPVNFRMLNLRWKKERTYFLLILLADNHSSWR